MVDAVRSAQEVADRLADQWSAMTADDSPHRAQLRRLADAGRDVIERMAGTELDPAAIERATRALEEAAAALRGPRRMRQETAFAEAANAGGTPHAHFDHSPVMGVANPIAPSARLERLRDDQVVLHLRFGSAYEGPPSSVHGGVIAAAFDEVLGLTQSLGGQPGMTGTLSVRYRRPTPLHRDLRFVGTLVGVDGRKIRTTGACYDGDTITAEAEGLFITVDFAALAERLGGRPAPPS